MDDKAPDQRIDRTLARAAKGDEDAWRLIVESYSKRVYALLLRQCGDRELAEELTQATFVKVVTQVGRYQERGKFEPWLFRIAINRLRDEMRRRKRQARPMDMSGASTSGDGEDSPWGWAQDRVVEGFAGRPTASRDEPPEVALRAEQIEQLRRAIRTLSPADQEILALRHTAGLSFAEIAETLDEPLGTVLARGHRALAKLRKLMDDKEDRE